MMHHARNHVTGLRSRTGGFTILRVLFGTFVLATLGVLILRILVQNRRLTALAEQKESAVQIASSQLELLKACGGDTGEDSLARIRDEVSRSVAVLPSASVELVVLPEAEGLLRADSIVAWGDSTERREVRLTTLIAEPGRRAGP